jgi:hypothetical protein
LSIVARGNIPASLIAHRNLFESGGFPHEKSQSARDHPSIPGDTNRIIRSHGQATARALLQDDALLLREHVLLQEGTSCMLQRNTQKGRRMLL